MSGRAITLLGWEIPKLTFSPCIDLGSLLFAFQMLQQRQKMIQQQRQRLLQQQQQQQVVIPPSHAQADHNMDSLINNTVAPNVSLQVRTVSLPQLSKLNNNNNINRNYLVKIFTIKFVDLRIKPEPSV